LRPIPSWALPALAALALTACGGTQAATPPPATAPPTPSASASTPAPAPVATTSVTIDNFAFSPAAITVKAGATVTWTNQDQDAHTIAITGQAPSKVLQMGDTFSQTFAQPGTYSYICSIHPFMKGLVTVTP
jgi:plastocyanin